MSKPALAGMSPEELAAALGNLPSYRALQAAEWLARGVSSFSEMTNLPAAVREELEARFALYSSTVSGVLEDKDGTTKLQITLHDGLKIEAVMLPDGKGRGTACLSTQAGCPIGCVFCKTGSLGFARNLRAGEIIEQFLHLRARGTAVSRVVIMGMGEPLLNLGELRKALDWLCGGRGAGLSRRRVTLSTSGVAAGIRELAERGPDVRLAVSLTTADQALRERLMPIAKTNPLDSLRESLVFYQGRRGKRVTLEAALLGGVNTRREDAEALAWFVCGPPPLDAAINLIPWNPVAGLSFEGRLLRPPSAGETAAFAAALEKRGLKVTTRFRRGRAVSGACGQLGVTGDGFSGD